MTSISQEQIFKKLFDDYFNILVFTSLRFVNDCYKAEDIVQDVFVKIWQNFDDLKDIKDLKGYLFKAVKNSSLNYIRHLSVKQKYIVNSENAELSKDEPMDETIDEEAKLKINQAVSKLPDNWREAFVLSKYDNLKYHEIAELMNISQKTVEKYISKSLHFLRIELKDLLITILLIAEILFKK